MASSGSSPDAMWIVLGDRNLVRAPPTLPLLGVISGAWRLSGDHV
jgi:hypothetical protein